MLSPRLIRALSVLALFLSLITFVIGTWYGAQAQLIQLVKPMSAAESDLFGSAPGIAHVPGTPLGSPQKLIVRSSSAFLPETGPDGVRYVSKPELDERGEYPLQQKTVLFMRNAFSLGFLALGIVLAVYWSWSRRRLMHREAAPRLQRGHS